jgi:hypothetical protein
MVIEGELDGRFVRVRFQNGAADLHPFVRAMADLVVKEDRPLGYAGGIEVYTEGFYESEGAFLALMTNTLDRITKVEGFKRPQDDPQVQEILRGVKF